MSSDTLARCNSPANEDRSQPSGRVTHEYSCVGPPAQRKGPAMLNRIAISILIGGMTVFGVSCSQRLSAVPAGVSAGPSPTARQVLAAMPAGCESVMVRHIDQLLAPQSKQKPIVERDLSEATRLVEMDNCADNQLRAIVASRRPVLLAFGGSNFKRPRDIGVGPFNMREIAICADPLAEDPYAMALALPGVTQHSQSPVRILVTKIATQRFGGLPDSQVYFAFYGTKTMIRAQSPEDVTAIHAALGRSDAQIPARWRSVADDATLSRPFFMLRAFDPTRASDNWQLATPLARDAEHKHVLCVSLGDVTISTLTVVCTTDNREQTREMLDFYSNGLKFTDTLTGLASVKPDGPPEEPYAADAMVWIEALASMGIYIFI